MKKAILLSAIVSLLAWSCRDATSDSATTTDTSASIAASASTVAISADDIQTDVTQVIYSSFYSSSSLTAKGGHKDRDFWGCLNGATVTKDTLDGVTTITIDYGDGITDNHGRTKAGQIIVVTSGAVSTNDLSTTVTFSDFSIDDNVMNGSYSFTVTLDSDGNPVMTRTEDISITLADGSGTVTRSGTFTRTMTEGYDTPTDVTDDVWMETGSATMTDSTGTYSVTITSPIVFSVSCGYKISGTIEFDNNDSVYTLDYGDGTCDNEATITDPDGVVTTITLKTHKKKHH